MQLVKQIIKPFLLEDKIAPGRTIAIYPGRFQPFGPHHKKVFLYLQKKFGDVFIATSNKSDTNRHPLNFKQKKSHMMKMGIPGNKIIQVTNPYQAKEITDKLPEDTAVVFAFGKKDAGRLTSGKYFKKYKGRVEYGYKDHGYFVVAPHYGVKVAGMEVSGTSMRYILGSNKLAEKRKDNFKRLFGYWDPKLAKLFTQKFSIAEYLSYVRDDILGEFFNKIDINAIIEATNTQGGGVDDGPVYWAPSYASYAARGYADAGKIGYHVVDYMLPKEFNQKFDKENLDLYKYYPQEEGPIPSVSYMPAGVSQPSANNLEDLIGTEAWIKWKQHIRKINQNVGMEFIDFVDKFKATAVKQSKETYKQSDSEEPNELTPIERDDIQSTDLEKVVDLTNEIKYLISDKQYNKRRLLLMGGAAGHMSHPFDDMQLTFGDLKKIIDRGLGGTLNREDNVTEKLDGQNIMVSWKKNKLVAARNKGNLKNKGETALDAKQLATKFAGRGAVTRAFTFSMNDLESAISKLSDSDKKKMFDEGGNFLNLEIIYPETANVIDYDVAELIFHGIVKYDKNGVARGQVKDGARKLAGLIKKVNANVQKKFKIGAPNFLKVPKHQDFGKLKTKYTKEIDKLRNQYNLKDDDTVSLYHQMYWQEFTYNAAKQMNYDIPDHVLLGLTKRWAFNDKSYKLTDLKKNVDNPKFLDWSITTDKVDVVKMQKENMKPFERVFLQVGADIMKNVSGYLAVNPDKVVQKIKSDVDKIVKQIQGSNDLSTIEKMKAQLEKIKSIGGMDSVVPTEGLVFKYKGNTYKFTGSFAPINQILGLLKYSR